MGSMEAASITFRPDGTGWTHWSRDGGSFYVLRFDWLSGARGHGDVQLRRSLSGTWIVRGSKVHHQVERQRTEDAIWALKYTISSGHDVRGNRVGLLEFDRDLRIGTIGRRFALKSHAGADDPTINARRRIQIQRPPARG